MYTDYTPKEGEWRTFICTYRYKDADWTFHAKAENYTVAQERLYAIALDRVDGILGSILELPLPDPTPRPILHMIGEMLTRVVPRVKG